MTIGSISCIDKNGCINVFHYKYSKNCITHPEHRMIIFASCDFSDPGFFELVAKEISNTTIKVISITKNNDNLYGAKGIPDAAIPELSNLSGKKVVSSSQKNPSEQAEYRTPAATKVWDRLRATGKAIYDDTADTYEYT